MPSPEGAQFKFLIDIYGFLPIIGFRNIDMDYILAVNLHYAHITIDQNTSVDFLSII